LFRRGGSRQAEVYSGYLAWSHYLLLLILYAKGLDEAGVAPMNNHVGWMQFCSDLGLTKLNMNMEFP
jgi:hypothetical protein